MMSAAAIRQLSEEAAAKAAELEQEPMVAFMDGDEAIMRMPNLGDYRPKGWKLIEELFVDKSGWGSDSEPALSSGQFMAKVKEGLGYALIQEGQFQVYIGVFEKTS